MQQELWMRAKLQVLTSLKPVSAMIPATASFQKSNTRRNETSAAHATTSINTDNVKPETSSTNPVTLPTALPASANPLKASRTHQELHKELLLAHRNRPELQLVLERRRREQTDRERGEQARTPLEQVLLKRQQRHQEKESQQEHTQKEEPQLLEFVRVRQNLRKIHSARNKPTNSEALPVDD
ncbi:actin-associated protein FAM107A isoform X2 [Anguilla rostrata]|uniref:actin-associated protein FAM107A isoform X2 n=1 Tax=Anguilla rostrata TaxID=7938 RepID=UPI0030CC8AFE